MLLSGLLIFFFFFFLVLEIAPGLAHTLPLSHGPACSLTFGDNLPLVG
jgi:hypothetical protein